MNIYVVFFVFVFCGIDCGALDAERMALGGLRCNHRTYRSHSLQRKWEYVWYMFDISRQYFLWTICRRFGKYVKTDNILWIECVFFFLSLFHFIIIICLGTLLSKIDPVNCAWGRCSLRFRNGKNFKCQQFMDRMLSRHVSFEYLPATLNMLLFQQINVIKLLRKMELSPTERIYIFIKRYESLLKMTCLTVQIEVRKIWYIPYLCKSETLFFSL